jgi:hypothetical protein
MTLEGINVKRVAKTYIIQRGNWPVVFNGQAVQAVEWFFAAALVRKVLSKV